MSSEEENGYKISQRGTIPLIQSTVFLPNLSLFIYILKKFNFAIAMKTL